MRKSNHIKMNQFDTVRIGMGIFNLSISNLIMAIKNHINNNFTSPYSYIYS